ncbi:MAG: glycosyltransferase N-terminal domain-containing protein [Planctomycetota bacterium]
MLLDLMYALALLSLAPLIAIRAFRHGRYRRGWKQKLLGLGTTEAKRLTQGKPCLWLHAVSVGEVNLIRQLVAELERRNPNHTVVISATTDTGYDLARKHFGKDRVFFCPFDFSWAVRRTCKHLKPELLVLAELELWPNLIHAADRCGCAATVINGRLSDNSASRYQGFGWLTRPLFQALRHVECQDHSAAKNFKSCGTPAERIGVSGSMKFDNAPNGRENHQVQSRLAWAGVDPWHLVWMVGSTQEGEEAMALRVYQRLRHQHPELRLILVPRHQERFDSVATEIESAGLIAHRRSQNGSRQNDSWAAERVILIDTIGELRHWWGVSQLATVGGSFGDRGGQNMLEPAGYGCAVSFGPNTRNFRQIAEELLNSEAAVRVNDEQELEKFVETCAKDLPRADALGRQARRVVERHRGATQRTLAVIDAVMRGAETSRAAA